MFGLVFSLIGDVLLNIDMFSHGMGAFTFAQISYIAAFGLKPLKLYLSIPFYFLGAFGKLHLSEELLIFFETFLVCLLVFGNLDVILKIGLPIYGFLLTTMAWRSLVQAHTTTNFINILGAFGSFMFAVSDGFIAIDKFFVPIPHARVSVVGLNF